MATSESHCTDNFTLPVGATGPQGPAGPAGANGTSGTAPSQGPAGPPGNTKIDIHFIDRTTGLPGYEVSSTSSRDIGHVIFPGTTVFGTPTNVSFGYRVTAPSASDVTVYFKIGVQTSSGVATVLDSNDIISFGSADGITDYILTDTSFANLTTAAAVWTIQAYAVDQAGLAATVKCLALEIR